VNTNHPARSAHRWGLNPGLGLDFQTLESGRAFSDSPPDDFNRLKFPPGKLPSRRRLSL